MSFPTTLRAALALIACLAAAPVAARSSQDGNVAQLRVRATDGLVYFYIDGPRTTPPACATQAYWVIGNEGSVSGRQQIALLTMAQAAGKRVTIFGTGSCGRFPDGENVSEVVVFD